MKFDKLLNINVISPKFIDILYNLGKISITPEIESELTHFRVQSWQKSKTYIIPILNTEAYQQVINDGFDSADASIFGIINLPHTIVITEDRPLQKYGVLRHVKMVFLIDFFIRLLEAHLITKNDLYALNQSLYKIRNITQKKYRRTKEFAQHY